MKAVPMARMDAQKERERRLVEIVLQNRGLTHWKLTSREAPDFEARSPGGERVGVEVSESLAAEHGEERARDHAAVQLVLGIAVERIRSYGGSGGVVTSSHGARLPITTVERTRLDSAFRAWLDEHDGPLQNDRGEIRLSPRRDFRCDPFVRVTSVLRDDKLGWFRTDPAGDCPPITLDYKAPVSDAFIEERILERLRDKLGKMTKYEADGLSKFWLVLRNPYQRGVPASSGLRDAVRALNAGMFARVFVIDDPEDRLFPQTRCIELL